jgi:hypothetical protein
MTGITWQAGPLTVDPPSHAMTPYDRHTLLIDFAAAIQQGESIQGTPVARLTRLDTGADLSGTCLSGTVVAQTTKVQTTVHDLPGAGVYRLLASITVTGGDVRSRELYVLCEAD